MNNKTDLPILFNFSGREVFHFRFFAWLWLILFVALSLGMGYVLVIQEFIDTIPNWYRVVMEVAVTLLLILLAVRYFYKRRYDSVDLVEIKPDGLLLQKYYYTSRHEEFLPYTDITTIVFFFRYPDSEILGQRVISGNFNIGQIGIFTPTALYLTGEAVLSWYFESFLSFIHQQGGPAYPIREY